MPSVIHNFAPYPGGWPPPSSGPGAARFTARPLRQAAGYVPHTACGDVQGRAQPAHSVRYTRVRPLHALRTGGAPTTTQFARALGATQRRITARVDALDEAGLVGRRPNPDDGRSTMFSLTEAEPPSRGWPGTSTGPTSAAPSTTSAANGRSGSSRSPRSSPKPAAATPRASPRLTQR
ncbi:MarR family winged helix-turn-helix transcriptional regulator [Streptomyces chartreusis]|uniref:MarR family winged helix-turn-helix transcriptional regulator n=1 Tax=Streptomyces chartreusis TaxID=1969 RepID=UPI0036ACD9C8